MGNAKSATQWVNHRLDGRIVELDGIRGLAILLVVIFHYVVRTVEVTPHTGLAYALTPLRLAWSGVDLFFVLSGFLIGGILYDARYAHGYYRTFYWRRAHRIFPLYFLWIALFIIGQYLTGTNEGLQKIFSREIPMWSYFVFAQNFFIAFGSTFGGHWTGITWSLAVEEQFYFLLPLLIRRLSTRAITMTALAAIVAAPVLRFILWRYATNSNGPYVLFPCRADALAMGVLIAIAVRNQRAWEWLVSHRGHIYTAFAVLGAGFVYLTLRPRYVYVPGLTWIAALCASVLLLVVVNPGKAEKAIFRNGLLTHLGTVAFAVYLSHDGINWLFHYTFFGSQPKIADWTSAAVTTLSMLTALLLSSLSWKFLEKPLIRHAHQTYKYTERASIDTASPSQPVRAAWREV